MRNLARLAAALLVALIAAAGLAVQPTAGHDHPLLAHANGLPTVFVATNVSYHFNPWLCDPHSTSQHSRAAHTPPDSNEGGTCRWPDGYRLKPSVPQWCGSSPLCPPERRNIWTRDFAGTGIGMLTQPWWFTKRTGDDREVWSHHAVAVTACFRFFDADVRNCGHAPPPGSGFHFYSTHRNLGSATMGLHDAAKSADRQVIVEICIDDEDLLEDHIRTRSDGVHEYDTDALRAAWVDMTRPQTIRHADIIGWTGDALDAMSAHNGTPGRLWQWNRRMGREAIHVATRHGQSGIPLEFDGDDPLLSTGDRWTCTCHLDSVCGPCPPGMPLDDARRCGDSACNSGAAANHREWAQLDRSVWPKVGSSQLPAPWVGVGGDWIRLQVPIRDDQDGLDDNGNPLWDPNPADPGDRLDSPWPHCALLHGI